MKLSALLLSALALLVPSSPTSAAPEGIARVHVHHEQPAGGVRERSAHSRKIESRAKMFESIAHMKETPWDSDDAEKAAKCDDLCLLEDFWNFQRVRNCVNRPTGLCTPYKLGLAGLEAVLYVADCDCSANSTDSSSSLDASAGADADY